MIDPEMIERVRQAIMRYRELLNLTQQRLAEGERRYHALFATLPKSQRDSLPEKTLQREAAVLALEDMEPLRRAVLQIGFDLREMHRAFEEVYNHIAPEEEAEE